MKHGVRMRLVGGLAGAMASIAVAVAGLTPTASASISPSASSSTATPLTAGAIGDLNLNLQFAPSSGDTPHALTINLPPGYLADAAMDGGSCLSGAPQIGSASPCQIGSGVISATVDGLVPLATDVDFYLVPPPAAGDLAGLAVGPGDGTQIGTTGAITIRPSDDPDGVGLTIALSLPDSLSGQSVSISGIDSTFTGLRYPATCPASPSEISVSASSYEDATIRSASLPIAVSGCGALPYAPTFAFTAARLGRTALVTTTFTQAADQSPSSSIALTLPLTQLTPALSALHELCADPSSGTCTPVASVTAVSPDYPRPLTGSGYLTGSLTSLKLVLVFPAPFPLTLVGSVDLPTNVTTFSGLPDFPLTSLTVTLAGGVHGLFDDSCRHPTGTATATTRDQNEDRTATARTRFTISGCSNTVSGASSSSVGRATVSAARLTGLMTGRPSLRFAVAAGRRSALRSLGLALPRGLSLVGHRTRHGFAGVSIRGATVRSVTISRGRLVLVLRAPSRTASIVVGPRALRESTGLRRSVTARRHRTRSLSVVVLARRTRGGRARLRIVLSHLGG